MQQTTTPFSLHNGVPPLQTATEPVTGVDSVPINPDHRPFADRELWKKKRRMPSPEDKHSPDSSGTTKDSEHQVDDYA